MSQRGGRLAQSLSPLGCTPLQRGTWRRCNDKCNPRADLMPFKNDPRQQSSVTFSALFGEGMRQKIDAPPPEVDPLTEWCARRLDRVHVGIGTTAGQQSLRKQTLNTSRFDAAQKTRCQRFKRPSGLTIVKDLKLLNPNLRCLLRCITLMRLDEG